MANVVLAHGIFGIGDLPFGFESRYFNGIRALFEQDDHEVLVPTVPPLGPLQARADALYSSLQNEWPNRQELIVIAHSMGGLDIRRVVAQHADVARRVKTIVAIATPHFGSPVADAILRPEPALEPLIPHWLRTLLVRQGGALLDLQTRPLPTLQDDDVTAIRYLEVGCTCHEVAESLLFRLSQKIGELHGPNDGVVSLTSARVPHRDLHDVWPVDHIGAIGWPSGVLLLDLAWSLVLPPPEHLERYRRILAVAMA